MLSDDREEMTFSHAPAVTLAERGSDEFAIPMGDEAPDSIENPESDREWFGKHPAYPRHTPEHLHTPDLTTRFYVGLWLPGAGALLTYALMRGNYWAAFVGIELLLVGWFTLAKL